MASRFDITDINTTFLLYLFPRIFTRSMVISIDSFSIYLLVLTAMAAKATVCVRPSEKRVTAHLKSLGREAIRKVMANEQSVASRRMADNSRPDALITGVCRWRQKIKATAKVNRIPFQKYQQLF